MSADGKQVTKQGYGVCEIRGRVGSCVHSVVFVHRNGETQVWGDAGGDEVQPFLLGETENICKVTACISKNHRGEWIRFTTTTGRDFMLRGHERDPMKTPKEQIVEFNAPSGYVVVGLQWSTGESARDGKIVGIVIAPVVVCAIEYATGSCVDRITFVNFDGSVRRYGGAADFRPTAREELNLEKESIFQAYAGGTYGDGAGKYRFGSRTGTGHIEFSSQPRTQCGLWMARRLIPARS